MNTTIPDATIVVQCTETHEALTVAERKILAAVRRLRREQRFGMIIIREDGSGLHIYATTAPIRVNE